MSKIEIQCSCGKIYLVPEKYLGKKILCKDCKSIIQVSFKKNSPLEGESDIWAKYDELFLSYKSKTLPLFRKSMPDVVIKIDCLLYDKDPGNRFMVACSFSNLGPDGKVFVPFLIQSLKDVDYKVRHAAIIALIDIGPGAKTAIPAFEILSKRDPNKDVRDLADAALEVSVRDDW